MLPGTLFVNQVKIKKGKIFSDVATLTDVPTECASENYWLYLSVGATNFVSFCVCV